MKLSTDQVDLTVILSSDEALINSVPEQAIRERIQEDYDYMVLIDKKKFIESLDRIGLFNKSENTDNPYIVLIFSTDKVDIYDLRKNNFESVFYENKIDDMQGEPYEAVLNVNDLETTLDTLDVKEVKISFGDSQAFLFQNKNINIVLPECIVQ